MGKNDKKSERSTSKDGAENKTAEKMKKMLANRDFFAHAIKDARLDADTDQACSKIAYQEQLSEIGEHANKFEEICMRIHSEANFQGDELTHFLRENRKITKLCAELKTLLREKIEACDKSGASTPNKPSVVKSNQQALQSVIQSIVDKTSPAIDIKGFQFAGIFEDWPSFERNVLEAMSIAGNASEEEKFDALARACVSQPKNLLNFFKGKFTDAFNALKKVYGTKYKQTSSALAKLMAIPHCMNAQYSEMSRLLEEALICEELFASANSMPQFEYAFAAIVIDKLSTEAKRAWERERTSLAKSWAADGAARDESDHLPNWEVVKNFLQNETIVLASESSSSNQSRPSKSVANKPTFSSVVQHSVASSATPSVSSQADSNALALQLQSEKASQPKWLQCTLCPGIHPRFGCSVYNGMNLTTKENHVWQEVLCNRCLRPNHPGDCIDPKCNRPCPKCNNGNKHNSTLCPKQQIR